MTNLNMALPVLLVIAMLIVFMFTKSCQSEAFLSDARKKVNEDQGLQTSQNASRTAIQILDRARSKLNRFEETFSSIFQEMGIKAYTTCRNQITMAMNAAQDLVTQNESGNYRCTGLVDLVKKGAQDARDTFQSIRFLIPHSSDAYVFWSGGWSVLDDALDDLVLAAVTRCSLSVLQPHIRYDMQIEHTSSVEPRETWASYAESQYRYP